MFGNESQGGGGKDTFVRLSGMFQTKKGNYIARIEATAFNTVFKMMQEAAALPGGTLNLIVSKNKKSGYPEVYAVVGKPYEKPTQEVTSAGPFGNSGSPAQTTAQPAAPSAGPFGAAPAGREVQFGNVDVPKDHFDSLLENL